MISNLDLLLASTYKSPLSSRMGLVLNFGKLNFWFLLEEEMSGNEVKCY